MMVKLTTNPLLKKNTLTENNDDISFDEKTRNVPQGKNLKSRNFNSTDDDIFYEPLPPSSSIDIPTVKVSHIPGVKYPTPIKELPALNVDVDPGNYTVADCMDRSAVVLEDALESFPETKLLFDNIAMASAYLQVIIPQLHENTEQSQIVSARAQATLEQMKILEKSLSKSRFDRTYFWWTGAAAVVSVVTYMVLTKATPTLVAPAAIDILKTTFTTTKDTVTATTKS